MFSNSSQSFSSIRPLTGGDGEICSVDGDFDQVEQSRRIPAPRRVNSMPILDLARFA
ncbi:hypothetical protein [Nocardia sp. NPDC004123]